MPKIKFEVEAPEASEVYLAGDFNNWSAEAIRLRKKRGKGNGVFGTQIPLEPGKHEFKFVVDGQWICDPVAPRVPNPFGTDNSVLMVETKAQNDTGQAATAG